MTEGVSAASAAALSLPAEVTHAQAGLLRAAFGREARTGGGDLIVDAAALRRFDSSVLALLLALRRDSQSAGRRFAVRALPERLRALAVVYGVAELLPVAD
jgi:phospholipid transport system transporter-binding protein